MLTLVTTSALPRPRWCSFVTTPLPPPPPLPPLQLKSTLIRIFNWNLLSASVIHHSSLISLAVKLMVGLIALNGRSPHFININRNSSQIQIGNRLISSSCRRYGSERESITGWNWSGRIEGEPSGGLEPSAGRWSCDRATITRHQQRCRLWRRLGGSGVTWRRQTDAFISIHCHGIELKPANFDRAELFDGAINHQIDQSELLTQTMGGGREEWRGGGRELHTMLNGSLIEN